MSSRASLVPLTPLRVVVNSMGNIVRRISATTPGSPSQTDSLEENDVPASTELEHAISSYFKAQEMHPEAVQVWALILPPDRAHTAKLDRSKIVLHGRLYHESSSEFAIRSMSAETICGLWSTPDTKLDDLVDVGLPNAISHGARLCRVLSGGGGWGKKAGLLSLDPDTAYSSREVRSEHGWELNLEGGNDEAVMARNRKALGEIVKEGDGIMFFLAPKDAKPPPALTQKMSTLVRTAERSAVFGVLPSTVDVVPKDEIPDSQTAAQVKHQPGLFGALSEGGMAIKITSGDTVISQSKYDVPFGYLTFTGVDPLQSHEDGVKTRARRVKDRQSSDAPPYKGVRRVKVNSSHDLVLKSDQRREKMNEVVKYFEADKRSIEEPSETAKVVAAVEDSNLEAPEVEEARRRRSTTTLSIRKHAVKSLDWRTPQVGLTFRKFRMAPAERDTVYESGKVVRKIRPFNPLVGEKDGSSK